MSEPAPQDEPFFFNGINGLTGEPLLAPMSAEELAELVAPEPLREHSGLLEGSKSFGLGFGLDPTNLQDAGWTVVFAHDESEPVRAALEPLIEHRRTSGAEVRVLTAEAGEDFSAFLTRQGVYPGEIEPECVGYYLMIVGSPASIDWEFQYHASIEYAVGRLALDTPEEYATYVASVIAAEREETSTRPRHIAYWGPRHDRATQLSHDELLQPLIKGEAREGFKPKPPLASQLKWESSTYLDEDATKANFVGALEQRPALLLTASHGIGGFVPGSDDQRARQGALLSADWDGPGSLRPKDYVAASDLADTLELDGLIAFHFACYGAGTPQRDCFRHRDGREPKLIADPQFVAALPKRMLAHPKGSALAVIGHVDRAWGSSFVDGSGRHIGPFRNTLGNLMTGKPVGMAVKGFSERYAMLSNIVADMLEKRGFGRDIPARDLAKAWLGRNDAQNFVVLGDPYVTLRLT